MMDILIRERDGSTSVYPRDGTHILRNAFRKEYTAWLGMKQRCSNLFREDYRKHYIDRGIRVCKRWTKSFPNFLADMKPAPSPNHTPDRRNNDGPYSPSNCYWATRSEQNTNRRPFCSKIQLEYRGEKGTLRYWSKEAGLSLSVLRQRYRRATKEFGEELSEWDVEHILFSPLSHSRRQKQAVQVVAKS